MFGKRMANNVVDDHIALPRVSNHQDKVEGDSPRNTASTHSLLLPNYPAAMQLPAASSIAAILVAKRGWDAILLGRKWQETRTGFEASDVALRRHAVCTGIPSM